MRNNHLNDNRAFIVRLFCLPFRQKEHLPVKLDKESDHSEEIRTGILGQQDYSNRNSSVCKMQIM